MVKYKNANIVTFFEMLGYPYSSCEYSEINGKDAVQFIFDISEEKNKQLLEEYQVANIEDFVKRRKRILSIRNDVIEQARNSVGYIKNYINESTEGANK